MTATVLVITACRDRMNDVLNERRHLRDFLIGVGLSVALFTLAWQIGRHTPHSSLSFAFVGAIFSYVFWMISSVAIFVTDLVLYVLNIEATYVPPPLATYVRTPSQVRSDFFISGVHCLITAMTNMLILRGSRKVPIALRRWAVAGVCLGTLLGSVYLLPADVLLARRFIDPTIRYATVFPNAVFETFRITIPIASNRMEMAYSHVPRLVGSYLLLMAAMFSALAAAAAALFGRVRWRRRSST